jgi:hypothetical protein
MDVLNNLNVVIGVIVGIFAIGGYLFGIVSYFRGKVFSSQQKQTKQLQAAQKQASYQVVSKSLSKLDWMEVLWKGFIDFMKSNGGTGWLPVFGIAFFGLMVIGAISVSAPNVVGKYLAIFAVLYFSIFLLFYVYFVGRRIEKKVEEINRPKKMVNKIQSN